MPTVGRRSPAQAIGRMDRRITIQKMTQGVGETYREPTESWTDWATVWANVYEGPGRALDAARQISAEVTTQFQIHWIHGLSPTMRISYEGRTYDIFRISEIGRKERWEIIAKARQT